MTLPEAIQILLVHQAWRLGADIEMAEPKVITEALDVLLNYHTETCKENLQVQLLAKKAYEAGQETMYCGCYSTSDATTYEEWYIEQLNKL